MINQETQISIALIAWRKPKRKHTWTIWTSCNTSTTLTNKTTLTILNDQWLLINQEDNCRIRFVYLVLFSTPFLMWLQIPFCFILYWSSRSFLIWFQIPFTVNHYSCYMCLLIQIYLSGSSFDSAENDKRVLPRSPSPPLGVGLLRSSPSHDSPVSINKSAPI